MVFLGSGLFSNLSLSREQATPTAAARLAKMECRTCMALGSAVPLATDDLLVLSH